MLQIYLIPWDGNCFTGSTSASCWWLRLGPGWIGGIWTAGCFDDVGRDLISVSFRECGVSGLRVGERSFCGFGVFICVKESLLEKESLSWDDFVSFRVDVSEVDFSIGADWSGFTLADRLSVCSSSKLLRSNDTLSLLPRTRVCEGFFKMLALGWRVGDGDFSGAITGGGDLLRLVDGLSTFTLIVTCFFSFWVSRGLFVVRFFKSSSVDMLFWLSRFIDPLVTFGMRVRGVEKSSFEVCCFFGDNFGGLVTIALSCFTAVGSLRSCGKQEDDKRVVFKTIDKARKRQNSQQIPNFTRDCQLLRPGQELKMTKQPHFETIEHVNHRICGLNRTPLKTASATLKAQSVTRTPFRSNAVRHIVSGNEIKYRTKRYKDSSIIYNVCGGYIKANFWYHLKLLNRPNTVFKVFMVAVTLIFGQMSVLWNRLNVMFWRGSMPVVDSGKFEISDRLIGMSTLSGSFRFFVSWLGGVLLIRELILASDSFWGDFKFESFFCWKWNEMRNLSCKTAVGLVQCYPLTQCSCQSFITRARQNRIVLHIE